MDLKRWSYFIRKVYETDPLTCPKCQGEMWFNMLTTMRGLEGRISFIDLSACDAQAGQPEVIKKILQLSCCHSSSPWTETSQVVLDLLQAGGEKELLDLGPLFDHPLFVFVAYRGL